MKTPATPNNISPTTRNDDPEHQQRHCDSIGNKNGETKENGGKREEKRKERITQKRTEEPETLKTPARFACKPAPNLHRTRYRKIRKQYPQPTSYHQPPSPK
ncbi:hypothetical protein EX30DRAFT_341573 [Ascodesmis nigricans]|uniref:Uncharacterized protein n=1 Tax=Ascodesmis nigricans TaxID=341454 RepID=A0A4V3SIJ2_9PEZI|nr:hypothetical protein EX30DRAFT_341573 [Ascodesmis nigricans]